MCAHIRQNRHIYRRVYPAYIFDSIPPPPIPQVDGGGCYREKFFLILFFWFYLVISWMDFYVWIIFLFFSRYNSILFFFKLSTFRLAVIFYLCVILVWFPVEFNYLVYITISGFDYNFGFCVFRLIFTRWILLASISTCSSIADSTLYLLNSLSL